METNINKNILVVAVLTIAFAGIFLRFFDIGNVYTEYDDVGVISIHKAHVGSKVIDLNVAGVSAKVELDLDSLKELEYGPLFPLYIASGWTYAPGQYFLFPLLFDESDSFEESIIKGRGVSAFFSMLSIFVFLSLLYEVGGGKITWLSLVIFSIYVFSYNIVLYAHHMSPYSTYVLIMTCSLLLIYRYITGKSSLNTVLIFSVVFMYFSYLTILLFLPFLYCYILKNSLHRKKSYLNYTRDIISLILALLATLPLLLFIKPGRGGNGILPPEYSGLNSIKEILFQTVSQLYISVESIVTGYIPEGYFPFFIGVLIFGVYLQTKNKTITGNKKILFLATLGVLIQWILLYTGRSIVLDQTRHVLVLLPVVLLLLFLLIKDIHFRFDTKVLPLMLFILGAEATLSSIEIIKSKKSVFNYQILDDDDSNVILLYRSTLGPLKYYGNKEKKVYYIDTNSFMSNYLDIKFPNSMLLVSQHSKITEEGLYSHYQNNLNNLFCKYSIKPIVEKDSSVFFPYNNYTNSSNKNGMYVYKMTLSSKSLC